MSSIQAAFAQMGVTMQSGQGKAQQALDEANANCVGRFNANHPDQAGGAQCRVVGVGVKAKTNGKLWSGEEWSPKADYINTWLAGPKLGTWSNKGSSYTTGDFFSDDRSNSVDKIVDQYSTDHASIVVIMLDQYEPKPAERAPEPPVKSVPEGTNADSMGHAQTVSTGTGLGGKSLEISDILDPDGQEYTVSSQQVRDTSENKDISDRFTFSTPDGSKPDHDTVTAVWKGGDLPTDHTFEYTLNITPSNPKTSRIADHGRVHWKGSVKESTQNTGDKRFPTWAPNPDKSWILYNPDTKGWDAVVDPARTDMTGADGHVFLDGDKVAGVVNGTVEQHLIEAPGSFTLSDDWSAADYLVDQDGRDTIRVYEALAQPGADGRYRASSVEGITRKGRDVTDRFTISMHATSVTVSAKPEYLEHLKDMDSPLQVTLLVPFTVNFANGKGAAQARSDHGRKPGEELEFCTPSDAPNAPAFTNKGAQSVNRQSVATNEPAICGYIPPVNKDVIGEASQGGDQSSVDGKTVYPGQKVEYQLDTQPALPANLGYQIRTLAFTDRYDQYLKPDKQTLEMMDLNSGRVIPKTRYTTMWDDTAHMFTLTVSDPQLIGQWRAAARPRLQLRFEGTVDRSAPADHKVGNQWMLKLNNSLTPSNQVFNVPPSINPSKHDVSSKDPTISIDGKTLLQGDTGVYRISIDASQANTAYQVWRLGVVDDYDEEHLNVDPTAIEVIGSDGLDYTKAFNIQVRDGVLYAFAKTVDTIVPATGRILKGDPQPSDLKAYAQADGHDPLTQPAIDQSLLGRTYELTVPYTVAKADGSVVRNTATQISNDVHKDTNTVSNTLKPINPSKDVTVTVGGPSANGKSVYKDSLFLYQLDSSILPAERAYTQVDRWDIQDRLNPQTDQYTGQWAVYATRDLYKDGARIAAKGTRIAGSGFNQPALGVLFTAGQDPSGMVTIQATAAYRTLISTSGEREAGWRAYIQCKRLRTIDRQENTFNEHYNDKNLASNTVWTRTPDMTPRLHVVKFDTASGLPAGDRNSPQDALDIHGDTDITVRISNESGTDPDTGTGPVFTGRDIHLHDETIAGDGTVIDWRYPDGWDSFTLKPGQSVDIHGTLTGVSGHHTDRVKATGIPQTSCPISPSNPFDGKPAETGLAAGLCRDTPVQSNTDDWNGKTATLALTGSSILPIVLGVLIALAAGTGITLGVKHKPM
ncbi:LPXTG cell wall anchor domain-containing protein [Bifidobacterium bombi]|nr:LPXTG cell wall anchor domain-containing protein [Bifidobacterium bombi]